MIVLRMTCEASGERERGLLFAVYLVRKVLWISVLLITTN